MNDTISDISCLVFFLVFSFSSPSINISMLSSVIFTNLACSHVGKKCLTKKLFVRRKSNYFAKTQCPEVAKTFKARTFDNMFSNWSNIFHTWVLVR